MTSNTVGSNASFKFWTTCRLSNLSNVSRYVAVTYIHYPSSVSLFVVIFIPGHRFYCVSDTVAISRYSAVSRLDLPCYVLV